MIGISLNNLRQYVWRKDITPCGRAGRISLFHKDDAMRLAERRALSNKRPVVAPE